MDKALKTMDQKQKEWSRLTDHERATFFRVKEEFPKPVEIPQIKLTSKHPYKKNKQRAVRDVQPVQVGAAVEVGGQKRKTRAKHTITANKKGADGKAKSSSSGTSKKVKTAKRTTRKHITKTMDLFPESK